ncbi:hypothetical protein [Pseudomonas sp. TMP9]|uniref:DUF7281 domain-containing protein n=1 Tax=Pseudomonas sp. TMP9 TaxID=3133144 RepID=UPI0030CFEF17
MDKSLIQTLVRICTSSDERFQSPSKGLKRFCEEYNIGRPSGAAMIISAQDKGRVDAILKAEGIDAEMINGVDLNSISRAEALKYAQNEKITDAPVRTARVAVKSLPGRPLLIGGEAIILPAGANLDVAWAQVVELCAHESVLLVENWEAFEAIHRVTLDLSRAGDNPLVLFRGSPVYQQDSTSRLLEALAVPVIAFVDFDPAGLLIALGLPHFAGLIWPEESVLIPSFQDALNHERYQKQLIQTKATLDRTTNAEISECWALLRRYGAALPQEYFIHDSLSYFTT